MKLVPFLSGLAGLNAVVSAANFMAGGVTIGVLAGIVALALIACAVWEWIYPIEGVGARMTARPTHTDNSPNVLLIDHKAE